MALYEERKKYSRFCKTSLVLEVTLDLTDVVPQFDSLHSFNLFRFSPNDTHYVERICLKIKPFSLSFTTPFIILEACGAEWLTLRTPPDLEVQGSSLARRVVSLDKELYSTLSLFTQVYKWIPATYCW